ncbi:osmoprotectant transport system ATP-binding protein [Gracilibacillus ureilyticus]|uniref:Quaternary amine transport ATP-binding protein n=1 Tax=Gracilibacillus ureilyticus TaxID=531814 RepID=A0A1H9NAH0_9BACI|nr:ABC transporter ATP-binding protein [Gracilibacillus ureilyticus]SER32679.1 osmoprotectant transport system ATP-binding protein [Gracilibacillus ureilyticus]
MITFENVTKQFSDGTIAVNQADFSIKKGELFVLIGPSGCGKTTTLKMMNRLIPLSEGTIYIDKRKISDYNIHELRWNIGYVLQQIALFPHMTIEENIAIVPEMKKWKESKVKKRVAELLEMVGLDPETYRNRKPNELSGGQQQRIGVIRALAADPDIILMDEPFSALDPISREKLQEEIVELQKQINKTIVFVTHDIQEALKIADRICLMKEGKVVQIGKPREFFTNPANSFVKDFVGSAEITGGNFDLLKLVHPLSNASSVDMFRINTDTSLKEVLDLLSEREEILVESDGTVIGKIDRLAIVNYFSGELKEGGLKHV